MKDTVARNVITPPHSVNAENSTIGSLLLRVDENSFDQVDGSVEERDFYLHSHRLYFRAITALVRNKKPYDAVTVAEWLESEGLLSETGGLPELVELAEATPLATNLAAYVDIVRQRSILRQLISVCHSSADAVSTRGTRYSSNSGRCRVWHPQHQGNYE